MPHIWEAGVTSITLCDPATGTLVECAIGGMTPDDLAAFPLDDQVCAEIARDVAPCLPEEFLAAYVQRVGVVTGGLHILGVWLERKAREILGVE
jgi:hypothetical protein